ncbi:hypothetical protein KEM55_004269 [Ascosphaera atra]|nr:hypothetical protein KEM55_004269 [Ascosphaera atra]
MNEKLRERLFPKPDGKVSKCSPINTLHDQVSHYLQCAKENGDMKRFKEILQLSAEMMGKAIRMEELANAKDKNDDEVIKVE